MGKRLTMFFLKNEWRGKIRKIEREKIKDIIYYLIGIFTLSLGITLTLASELGAGGWDALVENLYKLTSVSMGMWVFIIAVLLISFASLIKKKKLDLQALIVAFFTAKCIDFWYYFIFNILESINIWLRLTTLILGLVLIGFGSAMIFVTKLPKNHTETFVFSIVDTFNIQYKVVKTAADIVALVLALILGLVIKDFSNLGLGTILSTVFMGIVTQSLIPIAQKGLEIFTFTRREIT